VKDEFCRGKTTRGFDGQNAETDKLFQAQLFLRQPHGVELTGKSCSFRKSACSAVRPPCAGLPHLIDLVLKHKIAPR
jgi:hypothetical protein